MAYPGRRRFCMNLIGLSTQVPSQFNFTSDGPSRTYEVGKSKLSFSKTSLKESGFKYPESSLIVQALKALGEERIEKEEIQTIRNWLPPESRKRVLKDTERTTGGFLKRSKKFARKTSRWTRLPNSEKGQTGPLPANSCQSGLSSSYS